MLVKRNIYVHPMAPVIKLKNNVNPYVYNLCTALGQQFTIVNYGKVVKGGVLDILRNYFFKADVFYLNWIEQYTLIKSFFLVLFFPLSKLFKKKIVWTHHNQHSHKGNTRLESFLVWFLTKYSDYVVIHTKQSYPLLKVKENDKRIISFFHPFEDNISVVDHKNENKLYDLLIWGSVRKSKGVNQFLQFLKENNKLEKYKIKVIGKFENDETFNTTVSLFSSPTIQIENRFVDDDLLDNLHHQSRYVFFPYTGTSVLNSAALVKSLPKGAPIIGPDTGAFKELGGLGLINVYKDFDDVVYCLDNKTEKAYPYNEIASFCKEHTFKKFSEYLNAHIN
jgi:hypothetical protein